MQVLERETLPEVIPAPQPQNGQVAPLLPNGEAVATFLGAGVGVLALGILTTVAAISTDFANMLKFNNAVGPLSGKTIIAVVVWLVAWAGLYVYYKGKQVNFTTSFIVTMVLVGLGVLGTFPLFFDMMVNLFK